MEDDDPAGTIIEATGGRGVDTSIEAVGFEARGSTTEMALSTPKLEGSSGKAPRQSIGATRRGGTISVPGPPREQRKAAGVRVGCAGWATPRAYLDLFGDGGSVLARYATRFSIVEINTSFYRPHRMETYARWAATVPAGFRFSVKMPRTISHERALRAAGPALDAFLAQTEGLGRHLGGYLLQLPPSHAFDARTASSFFRLLRRRTQAPCACEPRHASWFSERADALMRRHAISRVAADPAVLPAAAMPGGHPGWSYWRWHGAPRMYYSAYSDTALASLAASAAQADSLEAPWIIFDNTARGFAVPNAACLQEKLTSAGQAQRRA